jgi:hypothetical protein
MYRLLKYLREEKNFTQNEPMKIQVDEDKLKSLISKLETDNLTITLKMDSNSWLIKYPLLFDFVDFDFEKLDQQIEQAKKQIEQAKNNETIITLTSL